MTRAFVQFLIVPTRVEDVRYSRRVVHAFGAQPHVHFTLFSKDDKAALASFWYILFAKQIADIGYGKWRSFEVGGG